MCKCMIHEPGTGTIVATLDGDCQLSLPLSVSFFFFSAGAVAFTCFSWGHRVLKPESYVLDPLKGAQLSLQIQDD